MQMGIKLHYGGNGRGFAHHGDTEDTEKKYGEGVSVWFDVFRVIAAEERCAVSSNLSLSPPNLVLPLRALRASVVHYIS